MKGLHNRCPMFLVMDTLSNVSLFSCINWLIELELSLTRIATDY